MKLQEKELFYEGIAPDFDKVMNSRELAKRLGVVFEKLLPEPLGGKKFLDAGCGTGHFSKIACERGAEVTALDVGGRLLAEVKRKAGVSTVIGDVCDLGFPDESFDIVLCTEVVEHVRDSEAALGQLCRVTKKNGVLILTTVNKLWAPLINLASFVRLRPYHGYENPPSLKQIKATLAERGFKVELAVGFNTPFFFLPFFDFFDKYGKNLLPLMVNIGIRARKL